MRRTQNARSNNYIVVKATVVPFGDSGFLEKSGQVSRGGIKFHVHPQLQLDAQTIFDSAINIGSSNAKDLMCYKLLQHGDATTLPGGILALLQGLNVGINPLTSGAIDYVALGITAPGDWFEAPPLLLPEADNRKYDSAELLHEALVAQDRHVQLLDTIFTQAATAQENVYVFGYERHQSINQSTSACMCDSHSSIASNTRAAMECTRFT